MIKTGETAPDFVLKDTENQEVSLKDYREKFVLLLFYPADNTRVCTKQLCQYRDVWQDFLKTGVQVFGLNPASPETHKAFKEKYRLPFPLLSDEDSAVAKKYGALSLFGLTKRAYVLIAPDGRILHSRSDMLPVFHTSGEELLKEIQSCMESFKNR